MSKDYARSFYNSKAWKDTQAAYMASQCYICERCGGVARIVHHKTHITPQNIHDPSITLDWANLEALCIDCHNAEHMGKPVRGAGYSFDENGDLVKDADVFVICGAPGSGKSTYVKEHKDSQDLVLDLDLICAALMGEDNIYLDHEPVLHVALEVRETIYRLIENRHGKWRKCWVITSTPDKHLQQSLAFRLRGDIVRMPTTLEQCIEHINSDSRRAGKEKLYIKLAQEWYATQQK